MADHPEALSQLMECLGRLPGIGERSAERLAFYLMKAPVQEAKELAEALLRVKETLRPCRACFQYSSESLCGICADPTRDHSVVMVVETQKDLAAFEKTGRFRGTYHVLLGHVSPHDGAGVRHLTIDRLMERVRTGEIREIILGTNPHAEGDTTALAVARRLAGSGVNVTRLARGLPTGFSIEFAGTEVLSDALDGRSPNAAEPGRGA